MRRRRSQVVIVMVGDQDSEGRDQSLELPAAQNELIKAMASANPKTDRRGEERIGGADAVDRQRSRGAGGVVSGRGRWTRGGRRADRQGESERQAAAHFPRSVEDTLASNPEQYPGVNGVAQYSEGLEVGYRALTAHNIPPLFPFGFGLSYTQFSFDGLKVSKQPGSANATVSFKVTNTGKRAGAEVAEVYLGFPAIDEGNEPPLQLKAFSKVMLNAGRIEDGGSEAGHARVFLLVREERMRGRWRRANFR